MVLVRNRTDLYGFSGEQYKAAEWMDKACQERDSFILWCRDWPVEDRRFSDKPWVKAILEKYGLDKINKRSVAK